MTRKHNVQTPGAPASKNSDAKDDASDTGQNTGASSDTSLSAVGQAQGSSHEGTTGYSEGAAPGADAEEMAQLRTRVNELEFEFDSMRENFAQLARFVSDRLATQAAPASSALGKSAQHQQHTSDQYAKMRAHEVDPTKITAPVLTADGHVVPTPKDTK